MDAGGSEYSQIFLMDLRTGESRMITDGESRNRAILWSDDGTKLAYQSTKRNGRSNDIWIANIAENGQVEHELALESPDGSWWGPSNFSKAGDKLLALKYVSSTNSYVYVKDLQSDKLVKIAGSEDSDSRNYGQYFSADGKGVFLLTDRYGDFTKLVYHDLESGKETVITQDLAWDVSSLTFNKDKTQGVFVTNEGGLSKVYLFDPKSKKYSPIKNLPIGVIYGIEFSPDGKRLGMSINTPKTPTDVFVYNLKGKKLERWTYSEVGGLNTDNFIEPELVHYPTFDKVGDQQRHIPAFVYKPKGKGPFPVIISIHGGPEGQSRPTFSSTYQLWLDELGAAVVVPNIRGSAGYGKQYLKLDNGFKREDSVKDIGALLD